MYAEEAKGVVGVAGHLCEGPGQDHGGVDGAGVGGGESGDDGPDEDETGRDLHQRRRERRPDETEEDMDDFEGGERLNGCEHGPGLRVGRAELTGGCDGGDGEGEYDGPPDRRDDVERNEIH